MPQAVRPSLAAILGDPRAGLALVWLWPSARQNHTALAQKKRAGVSPDPKGLARLS